MKALAAAPQPTVVRVAVKELHFDATDTSIHEFETTSVAYL